MFQSTLPFGEPELMRVSAFRRWLEDAPHGADGATAGTNSRLSSLSPSLLQDLLRFEQGGRQSEVLEVLAGCIRHARALVLHLDDGGRVLPLTVFPQERLVHCPVPIELVLAGRVADLAVMHVEPAQLRAPTPHGQVPRSGAAPAVECSPLAPFLWELALRGGREELLPEIAGLAAYRVSPGLDLAALKLHGSLEAAARRLRRGAFNLREIAEWPGFDRARAMRMLNGLYLQAGLIVSRTHPAAINEGWGLRSSESPEG
jgi:hypothetical protein